MLKVGLKSSVTIVIVTLLCTCIDPYTPSLHGYESKLVVDGAITDENSSYTIKLSRTIKEQDATADPVSDAALFITDNLNKTVYLENKGNGIYKTDSLSFRGITGRTYVLHINTSDDKVYESDSCLMRPVPDIDSIYYEKDQELVNNNTESEEGIRLYIDSSTGENNEYCRWNFVETWKFKVPTPKKSDYINDSTIIPVEKVKEFCWKNRKSDEVLIYTENTLQNKPIKKYPVFFIAAGTSDRLLMQYSILVRQYSISKKEYDFWNNLNKVNENGGDIFASQPFAVISNIHNVDIPNEQVLGYFQVSSVKQKRKNITFMEIAGLDLPLYHYPCIRIEMAPEDIPQGMTSHPIDWDELYTMYCKTSKYSFVEAIYIPETTKLKKLVFTRPECADCELTGTSKKPDFWTDL